MRRQEILKRGAIPEFVPVKELFEIFRIFTEVNLKNKMLLKQQDPSLDEEALDLQNIKDDIILI